MLNCFWFSLLAPPRGALFSYSIQFNSQWYMIQMLVLQNKSSILLPPSPWSPLCLSKNKPTYQSETILDECWIRCRTTQRDIGYFCVLVLSRDHSCIVISYVRARTFTRAPSCLTMRCWSSTRFRGLKGRSQITIKFLWKRMPSAGKEPRRWPLDHGDLPNHVELFILRFESQSSCREGCAVTMRTHQKICPGTKQITQQ